MNNNLRILKFITSGNRRTQTAKRNILGAFVIKGFSIIVQLLLVPMTLGYLSTELYGVWITLSSIILWISFFDIGLTLGLKNRLAEALSKKNVLLGKELVSTAYMALFCIFIPICIIGEIIIPYISWCKILNISILYNDEIIKAIRIIFGCICFQMIFNAITAILAAHQKVALSSIFTPIGNLISLIVIYVLSKYTQPSLIKLVTAVSCIPLIILFIGNIYFFSRSLKAISPRISSIRFPLVKNIFGLGIGFFFISLQYIIIFQSTNLLISYFSSPAFVTQYNISYRYLSVTLMIFGLVLTPFWPAFTDAYVQKDFNWMRQVYRKLVKLYIIAIFGLICMVILAPVIYHLWIGDEVEISFDMTLAVAIFLAFNNWNSLQSNLLNGIGAVKMQVIVSLIGLILFIPLALIMGNFYHAIGIIYAIILVSVLDAIFYTRELHKVLF